MKTISKTILIMLVAFTLMSIFNDLEDHVAHHFGTGITSGLDKTSYLYPDWTRKYVDGNPDLGLKAWWIPAAYYDGWHLFKIIRQFFAFILLYYGMQLGVVLTMNVYREDELERYIFIPGIEIYILLIFYAVLTFLFHQLFYETLF